MNQTFSIGARIRGVVRFLLLVTTSVATLAPTNRTGVVLVRLPPDTYTDGPNPLPPSSSEAPMFNSFDLPAALDTAVGRRAPTQCEIDVLRVFRYSAVPPGSRPAPDQCNHQGKNASGEHTGTLLRAATLSAQDYMAKPFSPSELILRVNKALKSN